MGTEDRRAVTTRNAMHTHKSKPTGYLGQL